MNSPMTVRSTASRPHGGRLVSRWIEDADAARAITADTRSAPEALLDARALADIEMIASGAFSPLSGFMDRDDYTAVVEGSRLASGLPWTIPVTLSVPGGVAARCAPGAAVALRSEDGVMYGRLCVAGVYEIDPEREAELVYGTTDRRHPGVADLVARPAWRLGGAIDIVRRPPHRGFETVLLQPRETRVLFATRRWSTVVAFQTRNPIHRAHEYILKCALEICDGLLLHPLVGATKEDDVPAPVRLECYRALLAAHFPPQRTVLSVFPAAMRYAGPREAVLHAIARKNYGCTHIIIGRDHAGVGSFYGPFDAQRIFDRFEPAELGITPLFFDHAFYCRRCEGMATPKTCPHGEDVRVTLSGTAVRKLLEAGGLPPSEYSRPEVAAILRDAYAARGEVAA
jgi:sulfate adenylyltransferase